MTAPSASASAAPTSAGSLDVAPLRSLALRALLSALDAIPEGKTLLLDPSLAGPLGLVADVGSLRQHGVERMFWLEEPKSSATKEEDLSASSASIGTKSAAGGAAKTLKITPVNAPTRAVVYVCRPESKWLRVIAGHVLSDRSTSQQSSLQHTYHLLLSPRRTELSLHLLSLLTPPTQAPLLSDLNLHDLPLELIPLENDLLSLEDSRAWCRTWRDGDLGTLHETALACMTLQHLWGAFPRIVGKGDKAQRLATLLLRQRREGLSADPTNPALTTPSTVVDCLIVLDRSTDLATPLCSQLTYAGLVDELIGIKSAHVEVDASLLSSTGPSSPGATPSGSGAPLTMTSAPKKKKHRLDAASDPLYSEIRDLNFATVGETLHRAAQRLSADYEGRHTAQTVAQMRAFVGKLGGLQSSHAGLRLHTSLTERIMAMTSTADFNAALEIQQNIVAGIDLPAQLTAIEALVCAEAPMLLVLRLLCLLSVVGGGIKQKQLDAMTRELLQTYGYQHLPLLLSLSKVGLLVKAATPARGVTASSGFASVRGPLRLINDDVDEKNPRDISYVYSGYAPLSIRLVQAVAQKEALLDTTLGRETANGGAMARLPRAHPIVGWRGFEDVVDALPGATVDELQLPFAPSSSNAPPPPVASTPSSEDQTTTTIVLFLGGVTYTEVAALRFMSRQTRNRRFLIATTGTVNGDELVASLVGDEFVSFKDRSSNAGGP